MTYYAIAHTYGAHTRRGDNRRMGLMVAFDTLTERDDWCAKGPELRSDYRYREPIESNDSDIAYFRATDGIVPATDLDSPAFADWL